MGDQLMLGHEDVLNDELEDVKPTQLAGIKRELSPPGASPGRPLSRKTLDPGSASGGSLKPNKRVKRSENSKAISRPTSPSGPPPKPVTEPSRSGNIADDPLFAGISARQVNVLKRKMKTGLPYHLAVEEAAK
jgi:hypothetical protein